MPRDLSFNTDKREPDDIDAPGTVTAGKPLGNKNQGNSAIEIDGREGPDPTRFGDWEKNGRCIDF